MSDKMLHVRPVQPADKSALQALVASTLGECLGTVLSDHELEAFVLNYQANGDGYAYYVADADGELAGYAVAAKERSSCGLVERLYVRHSDRTDSDERAVAQALVSALCHGTDCEVPLSAVRDDGKTALELYDRWGFVDVPALRHCLSMPSGHGRLMGLSASF